MTKGTYVREIETTGGVPSTDHGPVDFPTLRRDRALPEARVAVSIGYGLDFGKGKCSVTVSLACDQTEEMIDMAADMAMHKADQLADEGMKVVDERLSE
jgi:hypothetical protein